MTESKDKQAIVKEIRDFICNDFMLDPQVDIFSDDESLVAKGIVDSYGIIEIVAFIEERWNLKILDSEITRGNLGSLNIMADFILKKLDLV